jgi:hypothetical protein
MAAFSTQSVFKKRSKSHNFFKGVMLFFLLPCTLSAINLPSTSRASIHPSIINLTPGEAQKFKIVKIATPGKAAKLAEHVDWFVNNVPGGDAEFGFISEGGIYTAPAKIPMPHEVHIIGKTDGVRNSKLFSTVLVGPEKPLYKLFSEYTEPVDNSEHFTNPHCVAMDKAGNLLIADYDGSRVLRFTPEGKFLGNLGTGIGEAPGQIYLPRVVIADKYGDIYVSDQKKFGTRVQVFSHEGELLRMFGEKGVGPGEILRSHGIGFDSQDRVLVVDIDNMRMNVYSRDGKFIKSWGQDGPYLQDFNAPHGVYIDPNDDVFTSSYYGTLKKFDIDGNFLCQFFDPEPPEGSVYIHSISGDQWGNVYAMVRGSRGYGGEVEVSEGKVVSMEKFNNNGDFVGALSLAVKAHAENWVYVDEKDWVYFIYRGRDKMGFEIFVPQ